MSEWLPSLNALRAFATVARHLSYRAAADELGVTPAAVKQLVAKLEASVGRALVERRGHGLALTPAGVRAQAELLPAFEQIGRAAKAMRRGDGRQRLIVSSEPSFAAGWLVPRLDRFRRAHPDIDVLIDSSMAIADLARGAADIAIRYGVRRDDSLITDRLHDDRICAFCSPALAEAPGGLAGPASLARATLLHWDLSGMAGAAATKRWMDWRLWLDAVDAGKVDASQGLQFSDYNLAVQAAVAGQGVVLGSLPILRDMVTAGLLVQPFEDGVDTDIGYDLVTTAEARTRPEVVSFVNWALSEAQT